MLRVTYNSINKSKWAIVCDKNLWSCSKTQQQEEEEEKKKQ